MLKKIFMKLENVTETAVAVEDMNTLRTIINLVKSGVRIESEKIKQDKDLETSGAPIQLELEFVKNIQESSNNNASASNVNIEGMSIDKYGRADTTIEDKTKIEQLSLDLKECGPLLGRTPEKS